MNKKFYSILVAGILIGALMSSTLGHVEITVAKAMDNPKEKTIVMNQEEKNETEDSKDTVASEVADSPEVKVEEEAEAVSEIPLTTEVLPDFELSIVGENMVKAYNSYRLSTGRQPVAVSEHLQLLADEYTEKFANKEEIPHSEEIGIGQYMYGGEVTTDGEVSGLSILHFWLGTATGEYYILKDTVKLVGVSTKTIGRTTYFAFIVDWNSAQ